MSQALTAMENTLLDALASITDVVPATDLQIRDAVESGRWCDGFNLSTMLVNVLNEKRGACEMIGDQLRRIALDDPGGPNVERAGQIRRCSDMTVFLLNAITKQLPIYERIAMGLMEKAGTGSCLPT
jgi:hypothetical protein